MQTLTPRQRQAAKALIRRRRNRIKWFSTSFKAQLDFVNDPAKLKAGLCTRRAGKSTGVGELAIKVGHENPGVSIGLIGKTRDSIKKIYFKDIFKPLFTRIGWVENKDYWINKTELSIELKNGSMIYLAGADANEDEMNKFLGQKYKLVIVDEASMYANINLYTLIHEILEPAVADYEGTIIMIGTPSNYLGSYYHKVTTGSKEAARWSVHKWTWQDNPHVSRQITTLLETYKKTTPGIEKTAGYRQHWLGEWVVELSARVYKYVPELNASEPRTFDGYQYVLGVDLGYEDATTFVIGAWSHYDTVLHIVHAESHTKQNLTQVEQRIKHLQTRFGIGVTVVDGASKQAVEELQTRFQIPLQIADKTGKKDFIELMNNDYLIGRIKIIESHCKPLVEEYEGLVWDEEKLDRDPETKRVRGKWEEDRNCPNHCADAALYMWRWCYNYAHIPKTKPLTQEPEIEQELLQKLESEDENEQWTIESVSQFDFGD